MRRIAFVLFLLTIILLGAAGFFYKKGVSYRSGSFVAASETEALVERVGKLILLPSDEVPTVATVSDPSKLQDQEFFMDAKFGFKVLIYTNAKKAILYDPFQNKVIAIAPINTGSETKLVPTSSEKKLDVEKDENTF